MLMQRAVCIVLTEAAGKKTYILHCHSMVSVHVTLLQNARSAMVQGHILKEMHIIDDAGPSL